MKKMLLAGLATGLLCIASMSPAFATTYMIGDNDGYGMGIPDNAQHPFNGYTANYDGRSATEAAATNGAQYTDTYSTTHPGYGPQEGTVATFSFTGLGNGWTEGSMWFDAADFQAGTFGATFVTFNGLVQDWAFNDGFPNTAVHFFDFGQDVLDTINISGQLNVVINRNNSGDFYGFDYAMLSDKRGADTNPVPEPATMLLFGTGLAGLAAAGRRKAKK